MLENLTDGLPTYIEQIQNTIRMDIQAKKDKIIKDKFAEKGFAHLLENLETKRFKRVLVEQSNECEKWYADNGTDEGVLIVTFLTPIPTLKDSPENEFTITAEIKYY